MKKTILIWLGVALAVIGLIMAILDWTGVTNFLLGDWPGYILFVIGSYLAVKGGNMKEQEESLFALLLIVALADGEVSDEEKQKLSGYAKQFGISDKRFAKLLELIAKKEYKFTMPEDEKEKKKNITALVNMAKADGTIDDDEVKVIKGVAKLYGLSESLVDDLL